MASDVLDDALPVQGVVPCQFPVETRLDRFRGALLGLWLAPVAVALLAERWPDCDADGSDSVATSAATSVATAQETATLLSGGFALMHAFASEPAAFRQSLSVIVEAVFEDLGPCPLPAWLASLPALLRYHDSRSLRLQWLDSQQLSLQALSTSSPLSWAASVDHIIQLGDFLEIALSGWTPPLIDYVTGLCGEPSAQSPALATAQKTAQKIAQTTACDDFIKRLISAFGGLPEDWFAAGSVFPTALLQARPCKSEQTLLLGLLTGVLNGASQLPVLWQMMSSTRLVYGFDAKGNAICRVAIVRMADQLLHQWAGIQPIQNRIL